MGHVDLWGKQIKDPVPRAGTRAPSKHLSPGHLSQPPSSSRDLRYFRAEMNHPVVQNPDPAIMSKKREREKKNKGH